MKHVSTLGYYTIDGQDFVHTDGAFFVARHFFIKVVCLQIDCLIIQLIMCKKSISIFSTFKKSGAKIHTTTVKKPLELNFFYFFPLLGKVEQKYAQVQPKAFPKR